MLFAVNNNDVMKFNQHTLALTKPRVMGILNVTPDSFSDGGRHHQLQDAIDQAAAMLQAGACFIDVGGESTRPGAPPVSVDEELSRVMPVVEALAARFDTIISVDTSKPEVMRQSVAAGAGLINDVRALTLPGALETAAECQVPVCLMHMQGQPASMQQAPQYTDVVAEVRQYLAQRVDTCEAAGIGREQIILDPGFGFGKTLAHNYQLLAGLKKLMADGLPLLVGMSRKSMVGQVLNNHVSQRLAGSLALATLAAHAGAKIIRVHDVEQTVDVVRIVQAFHEHNAQGEV